MQFLFDSADKTAMLCGMAEVKIMINGGREMAVAPGNSLYDTLADSGIFVPSACGGRGGCGLCRLKIGGAGNQPFTRQEAHWLTDEERASGMRLACQVKVLNDLDVSIPQELLNIRVYEAKVVSLKDLTYDIKEVKLKLIKPESMEFRPGQYVQVKIPPYGAHKRPVFRTYSLANDPSEKGEIELEVRYIPNGISTTFIHKHLQVGDVLSVNGPHGNAFPCEGPRNVVLIAGGSGMSPIKSVLLDMVARKDKRIVRYYFGAKAVRDLFLVDLMREIEKSLADFRFIPALSDPLPGDDWQEEKGLIAEVVDRHLPDAVDTMAYLCGSPPMIDACLKVLKAKGMQDENIHYDKFV